MESFKQLTLQKGQEVIGYLLQIFITYRAIGYKQFTELRVLGVGSKASKPSSQQEPGIPPKELPFDTVTLESSRADLESQLLHLLHVTLNKRLKLPEAQSHYV